MEGEAPDAASHMCSLFLSKFWGYMLVAEFVLVRQLSFENKFGWPIFCVVIVLIGEGSPFDFLQCW